MNVLFPVQRWRCLLPYVHIEQSKDLESDNWIWRGTLSFQALIRRGSIESWKSCKVVVIDVVNDFSEEAIKVIKDCLREAIKVELEETLDRGIIKVGKHRLWEPPSRPVFFWLKCRLDATKEWWQSWRSSVGSEPGFWLFLVNEIRVSVDVGW